MAIWITRYGNIASKFWDIKIGFGIIGNKKSDFYKICILNIEQIYFPALKSIIISIYYLVGFLSKSDYFSLVSRLKYKKRLLFYWNFTILHNSPSLLLRILNN